MGPDKDRGPGVDLVRHGLRTSRKRTTVEKVLRKDL